MSVGLLQVSRHCHQLNGAITHIEEHARGEGDTVLRSLLLKIRMVNVDRG